MKLAIFGASGGTGRELVSQALAMGYQVKALTRVPDQLASDQAGLSLVIGDVLDEAKVREMLNGVSHVICSLGQTKNNPEQVVSRGTDNIIKVMRIQGGGRLIVITSLGVGDSRHQVSGPFKLVMRTPMMRQLMADKDRQEELVRKSGLDWIILRPGGLGNGPLTGQITYGVDKSIVAGRISRADLAAFALQQLHDDQFLGKTVAVT